jgi:hypothetical protein
LMFKNPPDSITIEYTFVQRTPSQIMQCGIPCQSS